MLSHLFRVLALPMFCSAFSIFQSRSFSPASFMINSSHFKIKKIFIYTYTYLRGLSIPSRYGSIYIFVPHIAKLHEWVNLFLASVSALQVTRSSNNPFLSLWREIYITYFLFHSDVTFLFLKYVSTKNLNPVPSLYNDLPSYSLLTHIRFVVS